MFKSRKNEKAAGSSGDICRAVVESIITCEAENWQLTSRVKERLKTA